jgi:hypothetical protein
MAWQERGMATSHDTQTVPEWVDEDPEIELTMEMDDEELEFDEFAEEADGVEEKVDSARDYVPLWRLIEMTREDRSLKMELADFEDYDDFENHDGDYARGLSH